MQELSWRSMMNVLMRIGLWAASLLLGISLFSLLLSLLFDGQAALQGFWVFFRVAMRFALPVWCLYLAFVIALKDAEGERIWTLLLSGSFIGPVSSVLLTLILLARGAKPDFILHGDPLVGWLGSDMGVMILSLIAGFLITSFYVIALRVLHRQSLPFRGGR